RHITRFFASNSGYRHRGSRIVNARIDDPTHQISRRIDESPSNVDAPCDIVERWSDQFARPGDILNGMAAGAAELSDDPRPTTLRIATSECSRRCALIGIQLELPSLSCRNRNRDEYSHVGQEFEGTYSRV